MKRSTSGSVWFVWKSLDRPTRSILLLQVDRTSEDRLRDKRSISTCDGLLKVSCTETWAWKIFLTFDENHGLTRFKICKFIDYSKISILWTKKPPFNKTTWSNDKTKVSCTERWAEKKFGTDDQNHGLTRFKRCKFFDYSKMSFLWTKKPPFDKTTWSNDKPKVSCTEK